MTIIWFHRFPEVSKEETRPEQVRALMKLWDVGIINRYEFDLHLVAIATTDYTQTPAEEGE